MKKRLKFLGLLFAIGSMSLASCSSITEILDSYFDSRNQSQESVESKIDSNEGSVIALNEADEALRYEIYKKAVSDGYQGTYEEWLASIKGADGSTILFGQAAPTSSQGKDSDIYIDVSAWDVYIKAKDTWTKLGNLIGSQGSQGEQGPQGEQGEQGPKGDTGTSLLTGNGMPSITLGNNGDCYLDLMTFDFYTKANGVWTKQGNIKGADGAQGQQGQAGQQGQQGEQGQPGQNGESAYEIAVRLGFRGTEEEWLASLKGADATQPEAIKHCVTFDSRGGTAVTSQEVVHGEKAKKPANPERDGYTFVEWIDENDDHWVFNGYCITEDITLYAVWHEDEGGGEQPPAHEHAFADEYSFDEQYHYHAALCGHDVVDGKELHDFNDEIIEPTEEAGGYTLHTCSVCGYTYKDNFTNPLQHVHEFEEAWSSDENTHWHAALCGHDVKEGEANHEFETEVVQPTEDEGGYTVYTCKVCGYQKRGDFTDPLVHVHEFEEAWSNDEVYHWHESTCGHDVKDSLDQHDFVDRVIDPTYEEGGKTIHICRTCGYQYEDSYTDPLVEDTRSTLTFDASTRGSYISSQYSTGNYVNSYMLDGVKFEGYRVIGSKNGQDYITLMDSNYQYGDGGLNGYFQNVTPIYGISEISVTYKSADQIMVSYGNSLPDDENKAVKYLEASDEFVTKTFVVPENTNFVRISSTESNVLLQKFEYKYSGIENEYTLVANYTGATRVKAPAPIERINGESKVTLKDENGNDKVYTYYSPEYVKEHIAELNLADVCYVSPVDVSNYYLAFRTFPANYIYKDYQDNYKDVFGSYLRQVSKYTRTDGYATAVPYNCYLDTNYPIYYELDIDLDGSYSVSSRGVGRIVIFAMGFSAYETNDPVMLYTDDHYATFQEYNNNGGFNHRFGAEMLVNGYVYSEAETTNEYMKCLVKYYDGDEFLLDRSFKEGTVVMASDLNSFVPEKEGAEFAGWYFDAAFTAPVNYDFYMYEDVNLYAKWVVLGGDKGYELDNPLTTSEAIDIINSHNHEGELFYVEGTITSEVKDGYDDTFWFELDNQFTCYYVYGGGLDRPSTGDKVIIYSPLVAYVTGNGSVIYETQSGSGRYIKNETTNVQAVEYYVTHMPENYQNFNMWVSIYDDARPYSEDNVQGYTVKPMLSGDGLMFFAKDGLNEFNIFVKDTAVRSPNYVIEENVYSYQFNGFKGAGFAYHSGDDQEWVEEIMLGDYSHVKVAYFAEANEDGNYEYWTRVDSTIGLIGLYNGEALGDAYLAVPGEYAIRISADLEFSVYYNDPHVEAAAFFESFGKHDYQLEEYILAEDNGLLFNDIYEDYKIVSYGMDLDELYDFLIEHGYVRAENIDAVIYYNQETDIAVRIVYGGGTCEISSIAYAESQYGNFLPDVEHNDGRTLDTAFTTDEAIQHINLYGNDGTYYFVRGIISSDPLISNYDNHTFKFDLDGKFTCYYVDNNCMTQPKQGDEVIVGGELMLYNNTTYETVNKTGRVEANLTNEEQLESLIINNLPTNINDFDKAALVYSDEYPEGVSISIYYFSEDEQAFGYVGSNANKVEVVIYGFDSGNYVSNPIMMIEGQDTYDFTGFNGCALLVVNHPTEETIDVVESGNYSDCYYHFLEETSDGLYWYARANEGAQILVINDGVVKGDVYTCLKTGEYSVYYDQSSDEVLIEWNNPYDEATYFFDRFVGSDNAIKAYVTNPETTLHYNDVYMDALVSYGLDVDELKDYIAEHGYVRAERTAEEVYYNSEASFVVVIQEDYVEFTSIAVAESKYGYINGTTRNIYKTNLVDESKKYFVWGWIDGNDGSWYMTKAVDGHLEFDLPNSLNRFIVAEFEADVIYVSWDVKLRQTDDMILDSAQEYYTISLH